MPVLERTQEVQEILLLLWSEVVVEIADDPVRFGARAGVLLDGVEEILCAPVMEEEDALPEAPEWRGTEFVGACAALRNAIGQV